MKDKAAVSTRRCQPTAGVGHFLEESCPHRDWTEEAGEEEEDKVGGGRNTGETDSRDVIGKKASGKKIKEERLALIFLMDWGEGDKEKGQSLQD